MKEPISVTERFVVGQDQPQPQDVRELAERGFQSVVNLRTAGEEGETMTPEEEGEQVRKTGMTYTHIPVAGDSMGQQVVDQYREEAARLPGPVFVHCASGKRSGAFTMMDVGVAQGKSGDEVIDEALNLGFECDTPDMKDFVRNYVDERR